MAKLLAKGIAEQSYRGSAAQVSKATGQTISAMGVWNFIQALGEKACEGEVDGIYIKLQGKDRRSSRQDKAEAKIGIAYDGLKQTGQDRYRLVNKVVVVGFSYAREFHAYRETTIAQTFNLDEECKRILNADRASWIRKMKDKSTCF